MARTKESEVPLLKGTIVRRRLNKVKSVYIDISFPDSSGPEPVCFEFQNYYSASISVWQQVGHDEYVPILEGHQLMKDAHCESEGQKWCEIPFSSFNSSYIPWRPLRIFMFQPDPIWQKHEIVHIKATCDKQRKYSGLDDQGGSGISWNVLATISKDLEKLTLAGQQQVERVQPEITFTLAEYRKMLKKKEKKSKKGAAAAAAQLAVTNDEFGISIPDFSKPDDIP